MMEFLSNITEISAYIRYGVLIALTVMVIWAFWYNQNLKKKTEPTNQEKTEDIEYED
jgi:H+/gluconate symporter-like permease